MFSYPYHPTYTYTYTPFFSVILPIIALIVIIAGGLALYFLFVRKPNRFKGTAAKLHDALNFRTFYTAKLYPRALLHHSCRYRGLQRCSAVFTLLHRLAAGCARQPGRTRRCLSSALLLLVLCRNAQEINS